MPVIVYMERLGTDPGSRNPDAKSELSAKSVGRIEPWVQASWGTRHFLLMAC